MDGRTRKGEHVRVLLEAVPDLERGDLLGEPRGELGVDRRLHVDPVRADAGLARAPELADNRTCNTVQPSYDTIRYRDPPSTAASMSASSNTMNGAFPPASMDTLQPATRQPQIKAARPNDVLLERARGQAIEHLRNRRASGERHLFHSGVLAHLASDICHIRLGRDNVDHARRDAGTSCELSRCV